MIIPSGGGVGMVNSPLITQGNLNSTACGFATLGELKLPFVTRGEFIISRRKKYSLTYTVTNTI